MNPNGIDPNNPYLQYVQQTPQAGAQAQDVNPYAQYAPNATSTMADVGKSAASGVGIGGGMMADAVNPMNAGRDLFRDFSTMAGQAQYGYNAMVGNPNSQAFPGIDQQPSSMPATNYMANLYQPQTQLGQYTQRATMGATTGLLGGPEGMLMGATGSMGGKLGGDVAADNFGEQYRPYGEVAGGLIGAPAGGLLGDTAGFMGRALTGQMSSKAGGGLTSTDVLGHARDILNGAKENGAYVDPESFGGFLTDAKSSLQDAGLDPTLHPATTAVVNRLDAEAKAGEPMDVQKIHTLRQIIADAAQSNEPRDAQKATSLLRNYDNYWSNLKPEDMDPSMINGSNPDAFNQLQQGIKLYSQGKRLQQIEDLYKGVDMRSAGTTYETALKNGFRSLAKSDMQGFSPEEQAAIVDAASTGFGEKMLRTVGMMNPTKHALPGILAINSGGLLGGELGGAEGAGIGSVAIPAAGFLADTAYSGIAQGKANYARGLVRQNAGNLMGLLKP